MSYSFEEIMDFREKDNREVYEEIKNNLANVVPFVGAGLTQFAYGTWKQALLEMSKKIFNVRDRKEVEGLIRAGEYQNAAQRLEELRTPINLKYDIRNQFSAAHLEGKLERLEQEPIYLIPRLFQEMILTTNFDETLETVYSMQQYPLTVSFPGDSGLRDYLLRHRGTRGLFKLHGTVRGDYVDYGKIVFTEKQYDVHYGENAPLVGDLKKCLEQKIILFLGCSLKKDRFVELLKKMNHEASQYTIIGCPKSKRDEVAHNLGEKQIRGILYEKGRHEAVRTILEHLLEEAYPQAGQAGAPFLGSIQPPSADDCGSTEIREPGEELPAPLTAEDRKGAPPNVYIGMKNELEKKYSIFRRLHGVKELTLLNFAGTAFITGPLVDMQYEESGGLERQWLQRNLTGPDPIKIKIILTNPDSAADVDASRYKMYPYSIPPEVRKYFTLSSESNYFSEANRELHQFIIRMNFNLICDIMLRKKLHNIQVFYTDVALPVGLMRSKFHDPKKNNLQVNIYLPCIGIDDKRPTFILMEKDGETKILYNVLNDVIQNIQKNYFQGHPDVRFLLEKPIIHRALLEGSMTEMSRDAVKYCAEKGFPVEVDLLYAGGEILVGRDEEISIDRGKTPCSLLTKKQLERVRRESIKPDDPYQRPQMMTLRELLELAAEQAQGKKPIPLLLELKDKWGGNTQMIRDNVIRICRIMKRYEKETGGKYALQSSNPYVIRFVKDYDIRIPCGWITLDFERHQDRYPDIAEDYKRLHAEAACFGDFAYQEQRGSDLMDVCYAIPDFVSCKIGDFSSPDSPVRKKCREYNIKMLGWAALNQEEYHRARQQFDNVLIENFEP